MTAVTQTSAPILARHGPSTSSKTGAPTPRHVLPYTSPSPTTHSGKLQYAHARDLPSFPSSGLRDGADAASVAATLGWKTKPPKLWTPNLDTTASTAALLANDGHMAPPDPQARRPTATATTTPGSHAAALAAGGAAQQRNQPSQPSPPSQWGNSAANLAFRASMSSAAPSEPHNIARQGSLRAAKGAMAARGRRPRATSSPMPERYPDQANAASNALSAATIAHKPSPKTAAHPVGGSVPFTVMDRQMYTSNPPVKPELDEKQRNDIIHASAVAMAKKMYSRQESAINTASAHAHARSSSFERHRRGTDDDAKEQQPMVFDNLQEAAYRLAQERLNKVQEEHDRKRGMHEYYGSSAPQRNNKLGSIRNKLTRRRSASDGALLEDKRRSLQIRKQMNLFDTKLAEVDEQKRLKDREALLATAHRNVQARLKDMDDKIQEETGWVQPSKRDDWEWKARVAAQAQLDSSRAEQQRKVDLGGGRVMDREEVEAIAAKRVQPLLDEINQKAELEQARKAALKADEEKKKMEEERDKMREKEIQEIHKQLKEQQKDQDRIRREELRREERERKELERQSRAEQKRSSKEGKQKRREVVLPLNLNGPTTEGPADKPQDAEAAAAAEEPAPLQERPRALTVNFVKRHSKKKSTDSVDKLPALDGPSSNNSSPSKVKTWFKNLSRPRSQSSPDAAVPGDGAEAAAAPKKKFIGGAALAKLIGRDDKPTPPLTAIENPTASASMRELALAGRSDETELRQARTPSPIPPLGDGGSLRSVSSMSSSSSVDEFEEARTTLNSPALSPITPPPPNSLRIGTAVEASPVRGSRFSEILE